MTPEVSIPVPAGRTLDWRRPRAPLLFFLLVALYLTTTAGHLFSPDEEVMFRTAESLALGRGLAIAPIAEGFSTQAGRDDRQYAQYGIGNSLLAVPWVWAGRFGARWAPASLVAVFPQHCVLSSGRVARVYRDRDGNIFRAHDDLFFQHHHDEKDLAAWLVRARVSTLGAVTTALAATLLCLLASEIFASTRKGVGVALLYGLCTVAWPHGRTFFSEPTVVVGLLWALWRLVRADRGPARTRLREFLLAGAGVGWMLLCRSDSVFLAAGLGVYAALVAAGNGTYGTHGTNRAAQPRRMRATLAQLACFAAVPLLAIGAMLALNYWRFGAPLSTGYESQHGGFEFSTPLLYGLYGLLLSPGRSLLVYSPILILAPWGWVLLWRRDRRLALGLCAMILLHLFAMAKWVNWGGGWDWGPRHVFQITPLLTLPLGALVGARCAPYMLGLLAMLSLGMNALGILVSPIDSHLRLYQQAYRRSGSAEYAQEFVARSVFSLKHATPILHARLLLESEDGRPTPPELGPWRPGVRPAFSDYDYDLYFIKLLRAPMGWLKWLATIPLLFTLGLGLAVAQGLRNPERRPSPCPPPPPPG
ncbi:hypothetical protein HS125_19140 [bacterium]|nr:hypothetical protein [bacterium]